MMTPDKATEIRAVQAVWREKRANAIALAGNNIMWFFEAGEIGPRPDSPCSLTPDASSEAQAAYQEYLDVHYELLDRWREVR
jgi:hypothetical protein